MQRVAGHLLVSRVIGKVPYAQMNFDDYAVSTNVYQDLLGARKIYWVLTESSYERRSADRAVEVFAVKRAEENVVGDAEDNRGRANAESQRADGDKREAKTITDCRERPYRTSRTEPFEVGVHRETVHPARVDFQEMLWDCRCAGTLV